MTVLWYSLISVIVVSLISIIGIATLFQLKNSKKMLLFLVSLSAGTLFGDAFLHLLPETVEDQGFSISISLFLLTGVVVFFVLEKFIHWHHCHGAEEKHSKHKPNHLAPLNLIGDGVHNFLDGVVIAASYFVSVPIGIATTIAVIFHEIPQEVADFGVLLYAGLSKTKALLFNFISALMAVVGAIMGYFLGSSSVYFMNFILPFAAGGFVYIAGSNLIPELHRECELKESCWHLFALILGLGVMVLLKFID